MFRSSSRVIVSYGRYTSTSKYLTLLDTFFTSFSTHIGFKSIILFYSVPSCMFSISASISISLFIFAILLRSPITKTIDNSIFASLFILLLFERVIPVPLLIRLSCYNDCLYGSRTVSIAQFLKNLSNDFYQSIHCILFAELYSTICINQSTDINQTILLVDFMNPVDLFDELDLLKSIQQFLLVTDLLVNFRCVFFWIMFRVKRLFTPSLYYI